MKPKITITILLIFTLLSGMLVFFAVKHNALRVDSNALIEQKEPEKIMTKKEIISEALTVLENIKEDPSKAKKIKEAEETLNNIKADPKVAEKAEQALKTLNSMNNNLK
ncbi:MAG: hypothetical protein US83_C0012G0059 [Candidatus Falkowbacteria bacterium GW2011_GWC2_38_22]|uniref:Uncharacterized protein n=1 Tax=Candidatus Falkowbacteria bacterium GW2011_GWE1_38_31 TaxID=1618638 RepID=A0A0G0JQC0_9BACT|nr:MAG: hypothetical protein US73_C0010G0060 [Candidatus Falkowbacteria bacterium GW2011_GWF2_38_1205]KKQ60820.1 MAG: hypothetical protein US83_C0012G0059 [Candidatus Falkowbacteria bacterium GW2011_GWC2_38_22]KKQ62987.1 MAG: hypothetical protein US84_C0010G0059 [Candidatus Falkowbacteria bacterium GW2011_GWF1_38_22]KKQ64999.1 MAG: hypothetical protein US87_C0010G0059 [Candidatus Falkowbacteria bacterium GW2011_GWE2_38_254]KKQ69763.1 MAG: hypothetical protein US91_C0010G0059 [Candidatus Falkowb